MRVGKHLSVRVLLSGLFLVLFTGCAPSQGMLQSAEKAPKDQQIFRQPINLSDVTTLDPALVSDVETAKAVDMMFTGLVSLDDNQKVVPELAQSWNVSEDSRTWTFHLRKDLKFSDGSPMNSQDIAYSIDRAIQPDLRSQTASVYLALLKDANKMLNGKIKTLIGDSLLTPNKDTLIIITSRPAGYFLQSLTYICSAVVEKKMVDKYGTDFTKHLSEGGGTGPFKLVEYTPLKQIVMVPNPYYYGPKPQLQKVIMPFYVQADSSYRAYEAGQIDETAIPSVNYLKEKTHGVGFHQVGQQVIHYYGMNYLKSPFDNVHIRKAFALALNKDLLVHTIWKDRYIATNHIAPTGIANYDNSNLPGPDLIKKTNGDTAKAREELQQGLQEKGWTNAGQVPKITIYIYSGSKDQINEAEACINMWKTVLGIEPKIVTINFDELINKELPKSGDSHDVDMQMWSTAWSADYPDPQNWLTLQFGAGAINNSGNYGDASLPPDVHQRQQSVQLQLTRADASTDTGIRMNIYSQAETQLIDDVAWLPILQRVGSYLLRPTVIGRVYNQTGVIPPQDWGNIYIAAH